MDGIPIDAFEFEEAVVLIHDSPQILEVVTPRVVVFRIAVTTGKKQQGCQEEKEDILFQENMALSAGPKEGNGNGNGNKVSEEEQRRELQVAIIQKWTQKGLLTTDDKKGLKAHHATPVEQMPLSELQCLYNEIEGIIKAKITTP